MQDVRGGDAAGEGAIDVGVAGIEHLLDRRHRRHRNAALVDAAVDRDVRMAVDDAGHDEAAAGVDDAGPVRGVQAVTHGGDAAVADQDLAVRDLAIGDGENGGVAHQRHRVLFVRGRLGGRRARWRRLGLRPMRGGRRVAGLHGRRFERGRLRIGTLLLLRPTVEIEDPPVDDDAIEQYPLGEELPGGDQQVRDLARIETAEPIVDAVDRGRIEGERSHRGLARETRIHRLLHCFEGARRIIERLGGEREPHAGPA